MHRLEATIPAPRFAPYVSACQGTPTAPIDLYRWANAVALAAFHDIAVVEVAIRSRMADELVIAYGLEWFKDSSLLDDHTLRLVRQATSTGGLETLQRQGISPDVIHGKLVSTVMFGFWVKLLGRGSFYRANDTDAERRYYDEKLWKPALSHAFPNSTRREVERAATKVQHLRNRVAHHEHIVWGVPIKGQPRLSLSEAWNEIIKLGKHLNPHLADWIEENSRVPTLMHSCPVPPDKLTI